MLNNQKTVSALRVLSDGMVSRLNSSDKAEFIRLNMHFSQCNEKNKRNQGLETFITHLIKVHSFINQGNQYDIFRGFVCGIEFGKGFIIVNTHRLKNLMYRSKSCVNGCLHKLVFIIVRKQQDVSGFFTTILPGINAHLCNSVLEQKIHHYVLYLIFL